MRSAQTASGDTANPHRFRFAAPVAVGLVTAACFLPTVRNELVSWDDWANLVENEAYRGLGWSNLRWMFTTFHMGPYQPLSWLTYAIDYLIWGVDPRGFHLTNLLLHAATAAAFYFVVCRLLERNGGHCPPYSLRLAAAVGALLFALHPLRVESVAWATERRDVLSGLLFMFTILAYLRYTEAQGAPCRKTDLGHPAGETRPANSLLATRYSLLFYAAALLFYILCGLSKATAMTLPIVLMILDFYPLRRLNSRGVLLEKIPFLLVAAVIAWLALLGQREHAGWAGFDELGFLQRLGIAGYAACFYIWKTLLPIGLAPMYERPDVLDPWSPRYLGCVIAVLATTIILLSCRRRWPAVLAVWLCYLVLLAPVSGLAQSGPQIAADRYTYLATLGFAVLAAAALLRVSKPRPILVGAFAVVVIVALAALSMRQIGFWRDSRHVWERALAVDPHCVFAHYNLAIVLDEEGDRAAALRHAETAVRLRPDDADVLWNYGLLLHGAGRTQEALDALRRAGEIEPASIKISFDYGRILALAGRRNEAAVEFQRILRAEPNHKPALLALGLLLASGGDVQGGLVYLNDGLAHSDARPEDYLDASTACRVGGAAGVAVEILRRGLQRFPDHPELVRAMAVLSSGSGR
jgi:tetratricopeptide (TPR) repeat protein